MPAVTEATPQISVLLFKTIGRDTIDGQLAVSQRYSGKEPVIDLTPFLGLGSAVRTTKSVRQPAGAFSISFSDQANVAWGDGTLESIYGLIEPMDIIEIRMWGGFESRPDPLPIIMRGFVSQVSRSRVVGEDGRPQRVVTVSGQDYGKIWQTYQVLYMPAYALGSPLLTTFQLWELLGIQAQNTLPAAEFVRRMVDQVINPHLNGFMPEIADVPRSLTLGDGIAVQHGVVSNNYQNSQGSVYDIMKFHGDVGVWNELYTEDREDGVHVVYRPIPAFLLSMPDNRESAKIQQDAPTPPVALIRDHMIKSINEARSDADVANFFWVNNAKYDLIDDIVRRLFALQDGTVSLREYPNAAERYYGVRTMYADSQQGEDTITNMGSNLTQQPHEARSALQQAWLDDRRRIMAEMNKDNVIYERGTAVVKGGPTRLGRGPEIIKAGDYALFIEGTVPHMAYVHQVDHEFLPFQSYTTTLQFDRGEGFAMRASMDGSPWLAEQARRLNDTLGLE